MLDFGVPQVWFDAHACRVREKKSFHALDWRLLCSKVGDPALGMAVSRACWSELWNEGTAERCPFWDGALALPRKSRDDHGHGRSADDGRRYSCPL
jgi:hypothetical protein